MPFIRSLASKHFTYYSKLVAVILLLNKIILSYFYYIEKGLIYIIITAPFNYQLSFYIERIKLNIYFSYNI